MKKLLGAMVLMISITGNGFAQSPQNLTKTEKLFELSSDLFRRVFTIPLDKGNSLKIELYDMDDLKKFHNMDSVLAVLLKDIQPFQDSLSDELAAKRVDYVIDSTGRKKIRIQHFAPKGSSYLVGQNGPAALKIEQDTIYISGAVSYRAKYALRKAYMATRYYRLSFFINNIADMQNYMDGSLNKKIEALQNDVDGNWTNKKTTGEYKGMYTDKDAVAMAKQPHGFTSLGDFLELRASVNLQNYKNYFSPSFGLGASLVLTNRNNFKRDIGLFWEPNFVFAKNAQGNIQTFRNDFLTLTFGQGPVKDHDARKESVFITTFSIAYLINRNGSYFDNQTWRIGAGAISLFEGKTRIEPAFYFNHFFKGVSPGIRWIQSF
jgi:hypothetical protein